MIGGGGGGQGGGGRSNNGKGEDGKKMEREDGDRGRNKENIIFKSWKHIHSYIHTLKNNIYSFIKKISTQ